MGLLKTAATVAVASSVHGRVQRRQQQRWATQEHGVHLAQAEHAGYPAPPAPPAAPAAAPAAPPADAAAQLELLAKLGELKQSGILTEEEFQAKKAEILNG
jgi:hypothetical protein